MLNFYPGPSKLAPYISEYMQKAVDSGILEMNHRSSDFAQLYKEVKRQFHSKLAVPTDYQLFFVSSATESWEIIAQSLIINKSLHLYNGAFGKKWSEYTRQLDVDVETIEFESDELLAIDKLNTDADTIALTHNETANGTCLPIQLQLWLREKFPDKLIAYDATSSMAGKDIDWKLGDIWFASVQKCFGLPSGMGVMLASPAAIARAETVGEASHYNSFNFILKNSSKEQTHYTPNILNIYLLKSVLESRSTIEYVSKLIESRAHKIYSELGLLKKFSPFILKEECRSDTVIALQGNKEDILKVKEAARQKGIIVGNGYGELKDTTIRIANFPAIPDKDYQALLNFLSAFDK